MAKKNNPVEIGIQEGIEELMERFPHIRDPKYIWGNLNQRALRQKATDLSEEAEYLMKTHRYSPNVAGEYISDEMAKYVISGEPFKAQAKELIFRENLQADANAPWYHPLKKRRASAELAAGDELTDAITSLRNVAVSISARGYGPDSAPEIYKALAKLDQKGFSYAAIDALKAENLIDEGEARRIKSDLAAKVKKEKGEVIELIKKHAIEEGGLEQKIATSVLGIAGVGSLVYSGLSFTGNAVGFSTISATFIGAGGIILLIIALIILLRALKNKKRKRKKRL